MKKYLMIAALTGLSIGCDKTKEDSSINTSGADQQEVVDKFTSIENVKDLNDHLKFLQDHIVQRELLPKTGAFPVQSHETERKQGDNIQYDFDNINHSFDEDIVKGFTVCGNDKRVEFVALRLIHGDQIRKNAGGYVDKESNCEQYELKQGETFNSFQIYAENGFLSGIKVTTSSGGSIKKGLIQDETKPVLSTKNDDVVVGFYGKYSNSTITQIGFILKNKEQKMKLLPNFVKKLLHGKAIGIAIGALASWEICSLFEPCDEAAQRGFCDNYYRVAANIQLTGQYTNPNTRLGRLGCLGLNGFLSQLKRYGSNYDIACSGSKPKIEDEGYINQAIADQAFEIAQQANPGELQCGVINSNVEK